MKFQRWLFTLLICTFSLAAFSFTSEPKQKSETTIIQDFTEVKSFSIVENVKEYTFNDVFKNYGYNFVSKESFNTTEKYIFDVGWQGKESYNYIHKKEVSAISFKYENFRIRNNC